MKISAIKNLVENFPVEKLIEAEKNIIEDKPLKIKIEGQDEGEKLTHVFAAIWILNKMKVDNLDFKEALKEYTHKVRESIN